MPRGGKRQGFFLKTTQKFASWSLFFYILIFIFHFKSIKKTIDMISLWAFLHFWGDGDLEWHHWFFSQERASGHRHWFWSSTPGGHRIGKKCGAQVVEMENLGTQPLRLQFWRWFSFSKGGMDSFHVAAGTWKTQLPQLSYPSWGDDPIWWIFFKWVERTN